MAVRQQVYTTIQLGPKQSSTPEGFLLCEEVAVARTGMMIYGPEETPIEAGPDGIVKIFRESEDVFSPITLASANGKPVVNDHPDEDVVPENWKDLTCGVMLNPRRGDKAMDDLLLADLLVTTPEGIKAVQSGKVEVSLGYDADYEEVSPGVGKQSNIIINHVALVEQGRCGPRCAIRDKKTTDTKEPVMANKAKPSKVLDMLMRAFKAKDAAEVEKLAEEVRDMDGEEGGDTHVHIHTGGGEATSPQGGMVQDDEEGAAGRAGFTDADLQAHIDQNAKEHEEMRAEIAQLKAQIEEMKGAEAGETSDEETREIEGALREEAPAGTGDDAVKARDSAYLADSFQDTVAMAEILVPGIKIPTFDRAASPVQSFKKICNFRRQALDLAYVQPSTRAIVDDILGGKTLDTKNMTCDAVRAVFRGAAAAQRTANNSGKGASRVADMSAGKGPVTLAEINRRNAERYKNA